MTSRVPCQALRLRSPADGRSAGNLRAVSPPSVPYGHPSTGGILLGDPACRPSVTATWRESRRRRIFRATLGPYWRTSSRSLAQTLASLKSWKRTPRHHNQSGKANGSSGRRSLGESTRRRCELRQPTGPPTLRAFRERIARSGHEQPPSRRTVPRCAGSGHRGLSRRRARLDRGESNPGLGVLQVVTGPGQGR